MKIKQKLLLGFSFIVFLMVIFSFISFFMSQKVLKKVMRQEHIVLASETIDKIDRYIYNRLDEMHNYTTDLTLQRLIKVSNQEFEKLDNIQEYIAKKDNEWISAPKEKITSFMKEKIDNELAEELREKKLFHKKKQGFDVYSEVFVTNKYGTNVAQTGKTTDYFQADEDWWQEAREKGFSFLDVGFDESSDVFAVVFGIRIEDKTGNFIGIMKVVLNIRVVFEILERFDQNKGHSHNFSLINRTGRLFYRVKGSLVLDDFSDKFRDFLNKQKINYMYENTNDKYLSYVRSKGYKDFKGFGWILREEHFFKDEFSHIFKLRRDLMFSLFFVALIALMISFFISNSISRPIKKLVKVLKEFGKGNLSVNVDIESKDEFAYLGESFNQMAKNLKKSVKIENKFLEAKVIADVEVKKAGEWETTFNSISDLMSVQDKNYKYIQVNKSFADAFNMKPDEIIGKSCYELVHNRTSFLLECPVKKVFKDKKSVTKEIYDPKFKKFFEIIVSPVFDDKGEVKNVIHVMKDITGEKRVQQQVEWEYKIQQIINKMLIIFQKDISLDDILEQFLEALLAIPWLEIEKKGAIFLVEDNKEMLLMKVQKGLSGFLIKECAGLPFGKCLCGKAAKTGEVVFAKHLDDRHDIKNDEMKDHGHYCVPILSMNDRVLGVINVYVHAGYEYKDKDKEFLIAISKILSQVIEREKAKDEKKLLEDRLIQAQKLETLGELAAGIAHDFNNILLAILLDSELLLADVPKKVNLTKRINKIFNSVEKGRKIIQEVSLFGRGADLEFKSAKLADVVNQEIEILKETISDNIKIVKNIKFNQVVFASESQLRQVLMNLLRNAMHSMEEKGGVLDVSLIELEADINFFKRHIVLSPGRYACLMVKDTGCGIKPNVVSRIFDPFFTTKEFGKGTGMGLAIVHGIIRNCKGDIVVNSVPGKGTVFSVYLPLFEDKSKE